MNKVVRTNTDHNQAERSKVEGFEPRVLAWRDLLRGLLESIIKMGNDWVFA